MIAEFKQVRKIFKGTEGLHYADFSLEAGQVVGLFGLNGAGKSTTLKLMSGLLKPDSGRISILGKSPFESRGDISFLGDRASFYPWMLPKDILKFMKGLFEGFDQNRYEELINSLEVPQKPLGQMSKGQQQRLRLAATMSRDAKLYLLDEPLSGIDLVSRELIIKNLVSNWSEESTILISTHEIREIEGFFDRGIYLRNGEVVSDILPEKLREFNQSMTDHFIEINKAEASL